MNRKKMLEALGLSDKEFKDLLHKFRTFWDSLDDRQRKVMKCSLPTIHEALRAFGPGVSEADLLELFEGDTKGAPVILIFPLHHERSGR